MNLYQASRCYFGKSQKALKYSLILSFVLLLLTIVAMRPFGGTVDAILIVLIASTQLLQMSLKYSSLYWAGKADIPRRMDQLLSGLGMEPSAEKCASFEEEIGKCEEPINPRYWRSIKGPGPKRMIEMILESSFYTRSLAAKCRNLFFVIGSVGLSLAAAALIISYGMRDTDKPNEFISHVVVTVLIFFLTGDFWNIGFLYRDLSQAANECHKQAYALLKVENITHEIALELALDYNTSVVQAPPLLSSKYFQTRDATDEVFVRCYGQLLGLNDPRNQR
jgi:hypothetical protein